MHLIAIDPGPVYSALVVVTDNYRPVVCMKAKNEVVEDYLRNAEFDELVIEMISSYGLPVGKSVFDTCVEIGRLAEIGKSKGRDAVLFYRKDVKKSICGTMKSKDSDVIAALTLRFAPGDPNYGKGTKDMPGWFFGFKADIWQAYALAVAYIDETGGKSDV